MNKVVLKCAYGRTVWSKEAISWLRKHGVVIEDIDKIPRHHPMLVKAVEELGEKACDRGGFVIEEIPDNFYYIDDYDGIEYIYTPSTTNWIEIKQENHE